MWGRRRQGEVGSSGLAVSGAWKTSSSGASSLSSSGMALAEMDEVARVFEGPEVPADLELVGHVVVELLGGFGYGGLEEAVGFSGGGGDFGRGVGGWVGA